MRKWLAVITFAMLAGIGCDDSPDDVVEVAYDKSADFCSYNTFKFYSVEEAEDSEDITPLPPSAATAETIFKNEAREQLITAGLTETETDPDLRVNFLWALNESTEIVTDCGSYWYGYWYSYACVDYPVKVTVGTVVMDLVDPATEKAVFTGIMQGIITGEDTEERIADAMAKVFAEYPPNITPCF